MDDALFQAIQNLDPSIQQVPEEAQPNYETDPFNFDVMQQQLPYEEE
jgi:hypothetical protein